jgi:hypothetical protein
MRAGTGADIDDLIESQSDDRQDIECRRRCRRVGQLRY